jgi:hypothetical protein
MTTTLTVHQGGSGNYTSISAALNAVPAVLGDTYVIDVIDSATYVENVWIQGKTTTSAFTLTFTTSTDAVVAPGNNFGCFEIDNVSYVTIDGFTFQDYGPTGGYAVEIGSGGHVTNTTVRNCSFQADLFGHNGIRSKGNSTPNENVLIEDCTFTGVAGDNTKGRWAILLQSSRNCIIRRCTITGHEMGLFLDGSATEYFGTHTVERCFINDCDQNGLWVWDCHDVTVTNCEVYDAPNGSTGSYPSVGLYGNYDNFSMVHCTVKQTAAEMPMIYSTGSTNSPIVLKNNVFRYERPNDNANSDYEGIIWFYLLAEVASLTSDNNVFSRMDTGTDIVAQVHWGNAQPPAHDIHATLGDWQTAHNQDANSLEISGASPDLFVDEANNDLQLTSTTLARDIGANLGVAEDILGCPRPYNAAYDAGAYEYQLDTTPPVITLTSPANGSTNVAVGTSIVIGMDDLSCSTGVDINSVVITLTEGTNPAETVFSSGAFSAAYVTGSTYVQAGTAGYQFTIDRNTDFGSSETIALVVDADDLAATPNSAITGNFSFSVLDINVPYLGNLVPSNGALGVSLGQDISFDILDPYPDTGVIGTSIVINIIDPVLGSQQVYDGSGGGWYAPYDGPNSVITFLTYEDWSVVIDRTTPFDATSTYTVEVTAEDYASPPNQLTPLNGGSFSFTTGQAFMITNVYPANASIDVASDTNLGFSVSANTIIDITSLVITVAVNGGAPVTAYDGSIGGFQTGWRGSESSANLVNTSIPLLGYDVIIDQDADFATEDVVDVTVEVFDTDPTPNQFNHSWSFTVEEILPYTGQYETSLIVPATCLEQWIAVDWPNPEKYPTINSYKNSLMLLISNNTTDRVRAHTIIDLAYLTEVGHILDGRHKDVDQRSTLPITTRRPLDEIRIALESFYGQFRNAVSELQGLGIRPEICRLLDQSFNKETHNELTYKISSICTLILLAAIQTTSCPAE